MALIDKIKNSWFVKELLNTFSNNKSFFSSKRIERFILFVNSMILLDVYCYKNWGKLTIQDILLIFGTQMIYAGFQVSQIRKDLKEDKQQDKTTDEK